MLDFVETLDKKQRYKLLHQIAQLLTQPLPCEQIIKRFMIEKYSKLFELRVKSKKLIRIIFTIREDGAILLLTPYVKKQSRDTMQALDSSLKLLARMDDGTCSVNELTVNQILEKGAIEK